MRDVTAHDIEMICDAALWDAEHDLPLVQSWKQVRRDPRRGDPEYVDDPDQQALYFWKDYLAVISLYVSQPKGTRQYLTGPEHATPEAMRDVARWWNTMTPPQRRRVVADTRRRALRDLNS